MLTALIGLIGASVQPAASQGPTQETNKEQTYYIGRAIYTDNTNVAFFYGIMLDLTLHQEGGPKQTKRLTTDGQGIFVFKAPSTVGKIELSRLSIHLVRDGRLKLHSFKSTQLLLDETQCLEGICNLGNITFSCIAKENKVCGVATARGHMRLGRGTSKARQVYLEVPFIEAARKRIDDDLLQQRSERFLASAHRVQFTATVPLVKKDRATKLAANLSKHADAVVAFREHRYEPALRFLRQAIKFDDKDFYAHIRAGQLFAVQGDLDKAKREYSRAVTLANLFHSAGLEDRGKVEYTEGNYGAALNDFRALNYLEPGKVEPYKYLAWTLAKMKKVKEATVYISAWLQICPSGCRRMAQVLFKEKGYYDGKLDDRYSEALKESAARCLAAADCWGR